MNKVYGDPNTNEIRTIVCGLFIFQAIAQMFIQVPAMVAEIPIALRALRKKWFGE